MGKNAALLYPRSTAVRQTISLDSMWKFRFDPQGARLSDSGYDGLATIQTETVKQGIYSLSTALIGVLFIVIALVIQFAYPLNKKTVDENTAELAKRREAK